MSLGKRLLASRLALALVGVASRLYRRICFGGYLLSHDPRLETVLRGRDPVVFACWHQDFVMTVGYLSRFNPRRRSFVLASASRDGGLAAASAEALGYRRAVRGSSAAGGASALRELQRLGGGARPASLVVVADGPRPPARDLKPGALHLARETGFPLWLVRTSWHPDPGMERTWARFHFPKPWARGVVLADGPIAVPPDLDRAGLELLRLDVKRRLSGKLLAAHVELDSRVEIELAETHLFTANRSVGDALAPLLAG